VVALTPQRYLKIEFVSWCDFGPGFCHKEKRVEQAFRPAVKATTDRALATEVSADWVMQL
jgi:hypothetical protein